MGLRGPNAKPVRKKSDKPAEKRRRRLSWQRKGLSRSGRVIAFVESLMLTAGESAGKKFKLRAWQKEIVERIYATDRRGQRTARQALVTLPRKNGKTQLAAALALAHLCGPEAESRGQIYSAAADRAQAALIYDEMVAMIEASPELSERIHRVDFHKRLRDVETGSTYHALSADARKAHGLSSSFVVYDELAQAPNRNLYDNLLTSTGARKEPLMVVISTQSSDPNHVMSELVRYGQSLLDGMVGDPTFVPIIYMAPPDADPWDEEVWRECNPALGDFRSLEEMRIFAKQAQRVPAKEAAFRGLYLNQPVDSEQRFVGSVDWKACGGAVDASALEGQPCWAGLDLSSTTDLTALCLYFPWNDGAVLPFFWLPAERLADRERIDGPPYSLWKRHGHLEVNAGRAIDRYAIALRLAELSSRYDIQGIAYDRWRIEDLEKILSDEGIDLPMVPWGQGYRDMGPAVDALETAILDAGLRHGNHPVLTWNAANVVVTSDPAGARKIAKDRAVERVDGMVALAMAVGLYARTPKKEENTMPIFLAV